MDLKDKVVVITGGSGGIGSSVVKTLLDSCDVKYVAIFELDLPECRTVFNDLQDIYGESIGFYSCDITKTSLISENFDKVIASHGTIDVLMNNAGIAGESRPELVVDVNFKAVVVASYMLIDRIGKHKGGTGGVIVNVSSILGLMNHASPIYSAAKHAVVSFTRTMKDSYSVTGVSVVALCPGFTKTPIVASVIKDTETTDFLKMTPKDSREFFVQTPENVAAAMISIVRNGEPGDVWVSEDEELPYSVGSIQDYRSLKIKDYPV